MGAAAGGALNAHRVVIWDVTEDEAESFKQGEVTLDLTAHGRPVVRGVVSYSATVRDKRGCVGVVLLVPDGET